MADRTGGGRRRRALGEPPRSAAAGSRRRPVSARGPVRPTAPLRTGLTVAAVLLVAAGTQVIPHVSVPPVEITPVATALPGVPFEARLEASRERVRAAAEEAIDPDRAAAYQAILDDDRQLLHVDPEANRGRGSFIELVGTIDRDTEVVGVLVPGSAAFILNANFDKYHQRATSLVEQGDGAVAMVVWAGGTYPKGWLQGALAYYRTPLSKSLAMFSYELRSELLRTREPADPDVRVVAIGHSFGGAVVGTAERYGLAADAVMHVASAGLGKIRDPYDYPDPTRPRYAMTGPGDMIGLVQGFPAPPGLGHGPAPGGFRCVTELATGRLPDDRAAMDEYDRPLGDRAGTVIDGPASHSQVFIPYSDAWWGMYRVLTGQAPTPPPCPSPEDPEQVKVRFLPLAVPRVVTASQCRTGGGLRPHGRHWPGRTRGSGGGHRPAAGRDG